MNRHLRGVWEVRDRAMDWEVWKAMVVTGPERVSEGKTLASDRCGRGLR